MDGSLFNRAEIFHHLEESETTVKIYSDILWAVKSSVFFHRGKKNQRKC